MTYRNAIAAILVSFLAACGGGGDESPSNVSADEVQAAPTSKLLVIGNSVSFHPPSPAIGWHGNWGMSSTSAEKDFAHLVAASQNATLEVKTFAELEGDPWAYTPQIPDRLASVDIDTVVVLQLGDNSPTVYYPYFAESYDALVKHATSKARAVVCVSTWWTDPVKDKIISDACAKYGGRFADIGGFRSSAHNTDTRTVRFQHGGVNDHPGDWGMARIAESVNAALK